MINDPLQKQIVPFTLEKCVICIIWQITQNLNWVAFRLSAQLLSIATHLSRLRILKLMHQTCWVSSYSYEVTQLRWFKRNICGHVFAAESAGRLSMWVSSKEEREYSILYLSYPLLMWVTPVCGLLGLSESYFLFHIFEIISFILLVQHSKSESCWENAGRIWGCGGGSFRKAVKDNEHKSILLNVLLLKKPMTVKTQPMLSARLANLHSKELSILVPSLVLWTGEANKETP